MSNLRVFAVLGAAVLALLSGCRKPEPPPAPAPEPAGPSMTIPEAVRAADLDQLNLHLARGLAGWRDPEGQTAVHLAVREGNLYVLDWLVRNGLDPCTPDASGLTPLHVAVMARRADLVTRLLFESCDLEYRDHAWKTAADYANELGYVDILERLAAAGAQVTLPDLAEEEEDRPAAKRLPMPGEEPELLEGDFRIWTSASGDELEGEFVDLQGDTLILRDRRNHEYRIHLFKLLPGDQILARQIQQGTGPAATAAAPSRTSRPGRSTLDKLARRSDWTILEGCRLLSNPSNDGDSFHVRHEGQEYIFRLYHVDTPETDNSFPDRVRDQALYFGISPRDAIRIGEEAKRFTARALGGKTFTVATQWTDAMGNSDLPRFFALVVTDEGDLDELLTRAGLVRVYGMDIEGAVGRLKNRTLLQLEKDARRDKQGAWGLSTFAGALP